MPGNFYDTLDVPRNASDKEISAAYRRLARRYHPDVAGDDPEAEARFKEVNAAHSVLSDAKNRAAYDKWGDRWEQAEQLEELERQGGFGFDPRFQRGHGQRQGVRFDFDENFAGSDIGDLFGNLFGGGRVAPARGRDVEHPVDVSLQEAFRGTTRVLQIPNPTTPGDGAPRLSRLEVDIPAGVDTGSRVKIAGKGGPGHGGGPAGDLFLVVSVADDPRFERRGDDLRLEVPVDIATAALGGEIEVRTLTGQVALRIPPATQNGRVFRLTGQGMSKLRGSGRGDLLAAVRLTMPQPLTERHLDLFRQLRDLESSDSA